MATDAILVIDAGTSALRGVTVFADGGTSSCAQEPWPMQVPEDAAPFGREFVASEVEPSLARLLDAAAATTTSFAGIAFTGQREGLVLTDEAGHALLVSPNIDARASAEGIAIDARHAEAVYRATGHLPSLMQAPAKLAWLRAHRPDDARRVRYAVPLADWLASTVTGHIRASRSLLTENGMLDIASNGPPPALWHSLDTSVDVIPPSLPDGACAGHSLSGHLAGLPVALCGGDTQCALVGAGATTTGTACVPAGWSAPVQLVTASPTLDPKMRTWASPHVIPDRWLVESNAGETGRVWQWLLSMLHLTPSEADAAAATSPVGASDVMAVLGPPRMNAAAMNAGVGGLTLPLPIVMSNPDRGDLLRAVLEAIAFAIRANLEQAEQVAGVRVPALALGGGMSRSHPLVQILANVIDRPVRVASTPDTTALGAAVLAAPALGVHDAFARAVEATHRPSRVAEPEARVSAQYDDLYQRWLAMCTTFESMP